MTFTWIAGLRKCGAGQVQPVHPTLGTAGTEHSHTWERAAALSVHCSGWDPFTAHCPVQGLAAGLALPLSPKPDCCQVLHVVYLFTHSVHPVSPQRLLSILLPRQFLKGSGSTRRPPLPCRGFLMPLSTVANPVLPQACQ